MKRESVLQEALGSISCIRLLDRWHSKRAMICMRLCSAKKEDKGHLVMDKIEGYIGEKVVFVGHGGSREYWEKLGRHFVVGRIYEISAVIDGVEYETSYCHDCGAEVSVGVQVADVDYDSSKRHTVLGHCPMDFRKPLNLTELMSYKAGVPDTSRWDKSKSREREKVDG